MPASVVHTARDEHLWSKAKGLATDAGRGGDYAYIMGIYKKMKGGSLGKSERFVLKSYGLDRAGRRGSYPGQIPGRAAGAEVLALVEKAPKPLTIDHLLRDTRARPSAGSVVQGLGLPAVEQTRWESFLERAIANAQNEVVLRKALYERFIEQRTPPELRKAIFERSMNAFHTIRKALTKGEPLGGAYYRRVTDDDGGYRYYYSPERYLEEHGHVSGSEAAQKRLQRHVQTAAERRPGLSKEQLAQSFPKHDAAQLEEAWRAVCSESGGCEERNGCLYPRVQKSMYFLVRR